MSKIILLIVCVSQYFVSLGQLNDTIYFDKSWKKTEKTKAKYYRLIEKKDSIFLVRDFYRNGNLQFTCNALSLEPEIWHGECVYYHRNGNKEIMGEYVLGKRTGNWTSFYRNGVKQSTGMYVHDKPAGIWTYFDIVGSLSGTVDYGPKADSIKAVRIANLGSKNDNKFSFALRGKLIGFFIIEDTYFSTATIGTEFLFKGRHSIGIDYTYFGWQYEHDDTKDNPLFETYERRGYALVDYKYRFLRFRNVDLYFNLYDKIGTYHMWYKGVSDGYNEWQKPSLADNVNGTFNQVGAGVGTKIYFYDRFYLDSSINGGKMFSNNTTHTYNSSLGTSVAEHNVKSEKNIFYVRVNFGYKLFVKK